MQRRAGLVGEWWCPGCNARRDWVLTRTPAGVEPWCFTEPGMAVARNWGVVRGRRVSMLRGARARARARLLGSSCTPIPCVGGRGARQQRDATSVRRVKRRSAVDSNGHRGTDTALRRRRDGGQRQWCGPRRLSRQPRACTSQPMRWAEGAQQWKRPDRKRRLPSCAHRHPMCIPIPAFTYTCVSVRSCASSCPVTCV